MAANPSYISHPVTSTERSVIFASSLGTIFEWYDFYLYATLAPFFAALFFPTGNDTAALLSAFATYAAGFVVRPFGALVFGGMGDRVGRKFTFLVTLTIMGASTFAIGLLPTYDSIGMLAPVLLVSLRLVQGLALGGEYGGAAVFVGEHAPQSRRGSDTGWIQTTATIGFLLSMAVIGACRVSLSAADFAYWGWRLPFLVSVLLLIFSLSMRLRLQESPMFQKMKAMGKISWAPITESLFRYPNNLHVLLALLGATAGQGVVWYTGQFYALFFLTITLKVDYLSAYLLVGASLLLATPFFVVFGRLSDRFGRLQIIMVGCLLAALTYLPIFKGLAHYANPALEHYMEVQPIKLTASDCHTHVFVLPDTRFSDCDKARNFLSKAGLSFQFQEAALGAPVSTTIGQTTLRGWNDADYRAALKATGYPESADRSQINYPMVLLLLFLLVFYVTMVYGPMAAYLAELFPTRIRYTAMSLPYHIGNGWFGGLLPLLATALAAASGDIYFGLWYPIAVAMVTVIFSLIFMLEAKEHKIADDF